MKNPGLSVYSTPTMTYDRPSTHPMWGDVNDDVDPDRRIDEDEEDPSDFMPDANFGRWRTPGRSLGVPVHQGPVFPTGQTPENAIQGEIITPAEQDGADKILNGDHDSDVPSANPYVEHAREDLHTSASSIAVKALSGLLKGGSPAEVGGMDEAHDYLSQHFDGVTVNPHRGTLTAQSPAGTQLMKRHVHLPAIPEKLEEPSYSLTNKHGTFESSDPERLVRTMLAFQIMHNEIAERKKKDDDDGLTATSGISDWFDWNAGRGSRPPKPLKPTPITSKMLPPEAVFERGHGMDVNERGQRGGWIAPGHLAPAHWNRDATGVAYSPGHEMDVMLDRYKSMDPRQDPEYSDHTFTYAPNPYTGHTIERQGGGSRYFVTPLHPAARHGRDLPPAPPAGRIPVHGPTPSPHASPRRLGAVQVNDLCPVCASGYLEPYDGEHHECLNCGSLVKHVGFDKESAVQSSRKPPRGGLGRGLKTIKNPGASAIGMGLGDTGTANTVDADKDQTAAYHPLSGLEVEDPDANYEAPTQLREKGQVRRTKESAADHIDEFMGKHGFTPHHSANGRMYLHPDPQISGAYYRLTEGVPHPTTGERGWQLSMDHVPGHTWSQNSVPIERMTKDPKATTHYRQKLPDVGDRPASRKMLLAGGSDPIEDDHLNRAIKDVHLHGRNSRTFWNAFNDTAYEPSRLPDTTDPRATQRDLRMLSSVDNPGLARFVS